MIIDRFTVVVLWITGVLNFALFFNALLEARYWEAFSDHLIIATLCCMCLSYIHELKKMSH